MQHWNSFSTLYTPFQSYFLPVNHILLVRVGRTGQYWWVIVYNSLRTHDVHQYKSFFILCSVKLNPYHRDAFKHSLMEVSREINMWNPALFQKRKQTNLHTQQTRAEILLFMTGEGRYFWSLYRSKPQLGNLGTWVWEQVKWPAGLEGAQHLCLSVHWAAWESCSKDKRQNQT